MSHTPSCRVDWFNEARYGMFVHWGPYSVAGRGEWVMNRERLTLAEYSQSCVSGFTGEKYEPHAWAALARDAGMKYIVLTTRHHDGFALWDTQTSPFHAARIGPKRDLVAPFVEAVRSAGLRVGLYYSFADWTHPDYPEAFARDWPKSWTDEGARIRFISYVRAQLRELLTRHGKIDMLWYDGCIPGPLDGEETNHLVRQWQPEILINSRMGKGDFANSEQAIRPPADGSAWEACMTLNGNWGYHAGDTQWKSAKQVIAMLVETARGAGNLLLNVGPRGDGSIPPESERILRDAGAWLKRNGEFLPHSTCSPFTWSTSGMVTTRGNVVYLHLFNHPGRRFCYAEIANRILGVRDVATRAELSFTHDRDGRLWIDGIEPPTNGIATTLAITTEGIPVPRTPQSTFWIPGE